MNSSTAYMSPYAQYFFCSFLQLTFFGRIVFIPKNRALIPKYKCVMQINDTFGLREDSQAIFNL